jgi:D-aminopeptidase
VRAPDVGLAGERGPFDAITDVAGVRVGHCTFVEGDAVRTGVTVILPHDGPIWAEPLYAGCHSLNGNGELTGGEWIRESGLLTSPIALTNTHSVGVVRDALVAWQVTQRSPGEVFWALPVVGETWDGVLNDVNGQHVRAEHLLDAIAAASGGPVAEGNVGSGTGMICHGFKGGIGTASRVAGDFVVGALVQANHGRRQRLRVNGVPVGELVPVEEVPLPGPAAGAGSIIVVLATDAPLLPHQLTRLAQRAGLGVARCGGVGEHWSGDLFFAFSTANRGIPPSDWGTKPPPVSTVSVLADAYMTQLFDAVVDATEEAIVNALLAAKTMTGRDGHIAYALDASRLEELLRRYGA